VTQFRADYRQVRPFAAELIAPVNGTDRLRAPTGWVFNDIYLIVPNTNLMRVCASSDRNLDAFRGGTPADLESGNLPFAIDFTVAGGWFPGLMDWRWLDIGFAETRCILVDQGGGWAMQVVSVWGTLVPDPRKYD